MKDRAKIWIVQDAYFADKVQSWKGLLFSCQFREYSIKQEPLHYCGLEGENKVIKKREQALDNDYLSKNSPLFQKKKKNKKTSLLFGGNSSSSTPF